MLDYYTRVAYRAVFMYKYGENVNPFSLLGTVMNADSFFFHPNRIFSFA